MIFAVRAEACYSPNVENSVSAGQIGPHRSYRSPGQTDSSSVSPVTVSPIITAAIGS